MDGSIQPRDRASTIWKVIQAALRREAPRPGPFESLSIYQFYTGGLPDSERVQPVTRHHRRKILRFALGAYIDSERRNGSDFIALTTKLTRPYQFSPIARLMETKAMYVNQLGTNFLARRTNQQPRQPIIRTFFNQVHPPNDRPIPDNHPTNIGRKTQRHTTLGTIPRELRQVAEVTVLSLVRHALWNIGTCSAITSRSKVANTSFISFLI
jgi:hypothetical protein